MLDAVLLATITLMFWAWLRLRSGDDVWGPWCWLTGALGLSLLTKGPVGPAVFGAAAVSGERASACMPICVVLAYWGVALAMEAVTKTAGAMAGPHRLEVLSRDTALDINQSARRTVTVVAHWQNHRRNCADGRSGRWCGCQLRPLRGSVILSPRQTRRSLAPQRTAVQDTHHDSADANTSATGITGGTEWIIDARGCRAQTVRSPAVLRSLFADVCRDLALVPVAEAQWHVFPGPAGVTGLQMLSESHLTCHTFPEIGYAALNLYCCSPKPRWAWETELRTRLGATEVRVRVVPRG